MNAQRSSAAEAATLGRPRAFETIVYGGLAIGILDGLFALIFYGLILGVKPLRIFQSVASGLLGQAAFEGGWPVFWLGVLLHFIVASCVALVYYLASSQLKVLLNHPVISGLIYGIIAYFVMNYAVLPLSAAHQGRFHLAYVLPEIIGHALLVGLPVALIARRSTKSRQAG